MNDGSKDQTVDICKQEGYRYLDLPVNLGLSGAVQAGLKFAYEQDYDCALQFDGDGQHKAEYIQQMIECMEQGYDIVIGSRFVTEKKPHSLRMLGNSIISSAIRCVTGRRICDPTSGMRLYNRKMIYEFAMNINYDPEPDTLAFLMRKGAKIKEMQVEMDERTAGESIFNFASSISYMLRVWISIIFIQWFRRR